ncbi:MAG: hypothetical protein ACP5Q1_06145 [Anaerolineae bacterium]
MERQIFHRDDIRNILEAVGEAGNALARAQSDIEFIRGYATAIKLIATAFGFFDACPTVQGEASLLMHSLRAAERYKKYS